MNFNFNCGKFLEINTYDQPGVEGGKIILKEMLKQKIKNGTYIF